MYCPLQSVAHERQLAHLMPQLLLSIDFPGQWADREGLASMCLQVLHSAISGCSADPARLWPLQLLAWLLQAQRNRETATEQVCTSSQSPWLGLACKTLPEAAATQLKHWPLHLVKQQSGLQACADA